MGEEELEQRLAREGYRIVRPETLPLAGQAAIFQHDRPVVGVMGSALHSLLFRTGKAPKPMAILSDGDVHGRFPLIDAVKGSAGHYLHCLDSVDSGSLPIQQRTLRIDVDRAMALLDAAGMLGGGPVSVPPAPPPVPAEPPLRLREEPSVEKRVTARAKDNRDRPAYPTLAVGDWCRVRGPSGATWLAIVGDRDGDRLRLHVVRRVN